MKKTPIRSIMNEDVLSVENDASVADTARKLREANVGALLVGQPPEYEGIVSERDIVYRGVANDRNLDELTVDDIKTTELTFVPADKPINECYELMIEQGFRHLPIQNSDAEVIGIVSIRSLFTHRDQTREFVINQLEKYIRGDR